MPAPGNYEMRDTVGQDHYRDGGEGMRLCQQHMIHRKHDLFSGNAKLVGDFIERIDGSAVDIGLAGFAEASVMDVDTETFEETLESGGAAIHVGGLDGFGNEATGHRWPVVGGR